MASQFPQTQPQQMPPQMPAKQGGGGGAVILIVLAVIGFVLLLVVGMCVLLGFLMMPGIQAASNAALTAQSKNNLKQIGLGIHNYNDVFRKLPRASMPDEKGVPRQSWRTAILPFMEFNQISDQMDQSKGWNESPNSEMQSEIIPPYHSPFDDDAPMTDTSYLAITGPEAAFNPEEQYSMRNMVNGTSNIIAVIEVNNSGKNWMEPGDISIDEAIDYITSSEKPVNALMMDGSVREIDPKVSPNELRKLMTRDSRITARKAEFEP